MSEEPAVIGSVFVSNYPPYSFWSPDQVGAAVTALDRPPSPDAALGLYLHLPFCRRRCHFCYFRVYTDKDAHAIARYLEALAREVRLLAGRRAVVERPLRFVYFGGGTPSYLSVDQLQRLTAALTAALPWDGAEEVTFECEPGTLTGPKVEALRALGVTRLSLGIESFDDDVLRANGRAHVSAEIARVRPWIAAAGFESLNVDLIAGLIGETEATWIDAVKKTIDYGPTSVTVYQMELPYNTGFTKDLAAGTLPTAPVDWATKRAWHDLAFTLLEASGYERSSAYTMVRRGSGARFVYRDSVWRGDDLLGAGVASFSHLSGVHFQNADGWTGYVEPLERGELPIARAFATGPGERLTRELILQLKLGEVAPEAFVRRFGVDPREAFARELDALAEEGFLQPASDRIRLTRRGLLQVDHLLPRFYAESFRGSSVI